MIRRRCGQYLALHSSTSQGASVHRGLNRRFVRVKTRQQPAGETDLGFEFQSEQSLAKFWPLSCAAGRQLLGKSSASCHWRCPSRGWRQHHSWCQVMCAAPTLAITYVATLPGRTSTAVIGLPGKTQTGRRHRSPPCC